MSSPYDRERRDERRLGESCSGVYMTGAMLLFCVVSAFSGYPLLSIAVAIPALALLMLHVRRVRTLMRRNER